MGEWQNGLFGCFSNCGVCIITYFLPCVTAGKNAEAVGKSCCLWGFLAILGPIGIYTRAVVRGLIREQKGIDVSVACKGVGRGDFSVFLPLIHVVSLINNVLFGFF